MNPVVAVAAEPDRLTAEQRVRMLEAVSRMAGGIAHDFNNVLTTVKGHSSFLLNRLPERDALREFVEEIDRAADRATVLTRQLLAFSRKQVLQPEALQLNDVLTDMHPVLSDVAGAAITVELMLRPGVERVKADVGQIQQVLLNLTANARDAMPHGGRLAISTANGTLGADDQARMPYVVPGAYVMLRVRDTGHGIEAHVLPHIFEPFFTTRGTGHGPGLGLSTVYGIVKQSGGFIWADSTAGSGSEFAIYLPVTHEQPAVRPAAPKPSTAVPAGTHAGTILVVEDENSVRLLVHRTLQESGYKVLTARSGAEALLLAEQARVRIDLLVTDVVMPGMSGRMVAERLAQERPGLCVLYISGYSQDEIARQGVLDGGIDLLEKPFTPQQLLGRVQQALAAADQPATAAAAPAS